MTGRAQGFYDLPAGEQVEALAWAFARRDDDCARDSVSAVGAADMAHVWNRYAAPKKAAADTRDGGDIAAAAFDEAAK